jgi:hypothetical protein
MDCPQIIAFQYHCTLHIVYVYSRIAYCNIAHCILHMLHTVSLHIAHCTLHITADTAHCTLYCIKTLHIAHCTAISSTLHYCILHTFCDRDSTFNTAHCTLHIASLHCTLHTAVLLYIAHRTLWQPQAPYIAHVHWYTPLPCITALPYYCTP